MLNYTGINILIITSVAFKDFIASLFEGIGYTTICYGDYPKATNYNPKMKLHFTKTLMQGNDCCNHLYTRYEEQVLGTMASTRNVNASWFFKFIVPV